MATRRTQDLILDKAVGLFNEFTSTKVSTHRLAAACGLSRGNLHYHFPSKKQIIQAIFQRMIREMDIDGYKDHLSPTLDRLAEMFARHTLLVYRYRFFYRELPDLIRADPLLMQRYLEYRRRRTSVMESFFAELDRRDVVRMHGNRALIKSLVESTWILCDNWLNSVWSLDIGINEHAIVHGYEAILSILCPYVSADTATVTQISETAILEHVRASGSLSFPRAEVASPPA